MRDSAQDGCRRHGTRLPWDCLPVEIKEYASGLTTPVEQTRQQLKGDAATATVHVLTVPDDTQVIPLLIG